METTVGIKPTQFPFAEEPVIIPARRRIFYIDLLAGFLFRYLDGIPPPLNTR